MAKSEHIGTTSDTVWQNCYRNHVSCRTRMAICSCCRLLRTARFIFLARSCLWHRRQQMSSPWLSLGQSHPTLRTSKKFSYCPQPPSFLLL
eukprot:UN12522